MTLTIALTRGYLPNLTTNLASFPMGYGSFSIHPPSPALIPPSLELEMLEFNICLIANLT
ncbi:hypothetical protein NIES39_D05300 [Arthrospira platensis NIES-39]|nr:hypothetical protein NIES39_D05300 [Arthrospira platensis NIES-39]